MGALILALAFVGVQPVVVIYATRNAPAFTIEQVRANALVTANQIAKDSYGTYTLDVRAVGPFSVPLTTPISGTETTTCRAMDVYNRAAEDAARQAGTNFPSNAWIWVHGDCGHYFGSFSTSVPGVQRQGLSTDGKMQGFIFGQLLGLSVAYASREPYIGNNPFDPYTPMGYMPKGGYKARERLQLGWLTNAVVRVDSPTVPSSGSQFLEATEITPTNRIKVWRLSNQVEIEVRKLTTGKAAPPVALLYNRGTTLIDLDRFSLCLWYELKVGQIFTLGYDHLGVRNDGIAPDGSGITFSVFPYDGPGTARCPTGSK